MKRIGLIVIGDEILSGKRQDQHFNALLGMLGERGLELAWAEYHRDDRPGLTRLFQRTLDQGDVVFSCGGIGATPDDHTRQAAAAAFGLPLVLHPEAARLIAYRVAQSQGKSVDEIDMTQPENRQRLRMGEFPEGCTLVPNPVNGIAGFSLNDHVFVPGFPAMAAPMMAWALDHLFAQLRAIPRAERGVNVYGLSEAAITPLLERIELTHPSVKTFSLPSLPKPALKGAPPVRYHIELGVKGPGSSVEPAFAELLEGVRQLGGECAAGDEPRETTTA